MKLSLSRALLLVPILFCLLLPSATMGATQTNTISPEKFLNADGTLSLNDTANGTLDLQGYNITLDPIRGPVFGATTDANKPSAAGNWAALGEGGGNIDGWVRVIAVSGTAVYVGGDFNDAANIPEADYIAKWDGSSWSALGSNGSGDGALNSTVWAIQIDGTDVYAGGSFTNAASLATADYLAKWDGTKWAALGSNGAGDGSLSSQVQALDLSGTDLYVGGFFTDVNNNGAILNTADYIAKLNLTTNNWAALSSDGAGNGAVSGLVNAIAISGTDVFVGGSFINVNNGGTPLLAADYVARWDSLTGDWSALGSDGASGGAINSTVYALAVSGSNLYVGGLFTNVNNSGTPLPTADFLARWDGTNWATLGSNGAGDGALSNYVLSLITDGNDVYVGGAFKNVNNNGTPLPTADYVAKWNGTNWSALGGNGASDGVIPSSSASFVAALATQNGKLWAGGGFYDLTANGTTLPQADFIAQWDSNSGVWTALGTAVNGSLVNGTISGQVYAIAIMGTDVYVGGWFTNISNHGQNIPEADYIAKWDSLTGDWSALGSNGNGDGSLIGRVYALAVSGTDLYVGGTFINVNNNGASLPTADYIAKWDTVAGTWSALGSNGAGNGALPSGGYVNLLTVDGTDLYVGGSFTNVNNNGTPLPEADYLAKWDGTNWSALGNNGAGDGALNSTPLALTVSGSTLYVGGYFTNAANIPTADYLASWNGTTWAALSDNGANDGSLNNGVAALALAGSSLYVGGTFTNVNDGGVVLETADFIAKLDTNSGTWSALGSNSFGDGVFCTYCGQSVSTLVVDGTDLYVGGSFTDINSNGAVLTAADYVAKWDGVSWSALGSNGAANGAIPTTNFSRVNVITVFGSDLLVGGQFSNVNNNGTVLPAADYVAAFGLTGEGPDTTPPAVESVIRLDSNPSTAASVRFLVTFTEPVSGLDLSNFQVTTNGMSGAKISKMNCTGATCTFTVSTGSGSGTIRLNVLDDDTIKDAANNPLGGVGIGNGDFTSGEVYTIQHYGLFLPLIIK